MALKHFVPILFNRFLLSSSFLLKKKIMESVQPHESFVCHNDLLAAFSEPRATGFIFVVFVLLMRVRSVVIKPTGFAVNK